MQQQTVQRDRSASRPIGTTVAYAFVLCLAVMACIVLGPQRVSAQERRPPDVARASTVSATLPRLPRDFEARRNGRVEWHYPKRAERQTRALASTFDASWKRIQSDLGRRVDSTMTIRVARDPDEMRALAPAGLRLPEYAMGVAVPELGLVLLTLSAPKTWERPPLETVLAHELSHIALYRAVDGRPVPRWFGEGLAVYQAHEQSFARTRELWAASVGDTLIPVRQLSQAFSARPHKVTLAYAQSADLIAHLRSEPDDRTRFRALIANLAHGVKFEQAVHSAYARSLGEIERSWHGELAQQFRALPLLISGGTIWVFASILIVIAYFRRKRTDKRTLQRWAAEESAAAKAERTARTQQQIASMTSEEISMVLDLSVAEPPQRREAGVPTIQYEGRDHTLH